MKGKIKGRNSTAGTKKSINDPVLSSHRSSQKDDSIFE